MSEQVILVDRNDTQTGLEEKLKAHQKGDLHRGFSILLFNSKNEQLIQKRAATKYHLPNRWSNACCSHPAQGELVINAAHRRLKEELGIDCKIKEIFSFVYKTRPAQGVCEHEYDHVLIGKFNGKPKLNPNETSDYKWISIKKLKQDIRRKPSQYTPWFKIIVKRYIQCLN